MDRLTDLKFFSMELLITLLSCAMYRNTMISPDDHVVTDDLFLVYVLQLARNELQHSRLVTSLAYDPNHASGKFCPFCMSQRFNLMLCVCGSYFKCLVWRMPLGEVVEGIVAMFPGRSGHLCTSFSGQSRRINFNCCTEKDPHIHSSRLLEQFAVPLHYTSFGL